MTPGAKSERPKDEFINFGDVGDGCARDDSRRQTRTQPHQPDSQNKPGDLVNYQSMTFVVWLAMAVVALLSASLLLLHTRRILARAQPDQSGHALMQARFAPGPAGPAPATGRTRSSLAS